MTQKRNCVRATLNRIRRCSTDSSWQHLCPIHFRAQDAQQILQFETSIVHHALSLVNPEITCAAENSKSKCSRFVLSGLLSSTGKQQELHAMLAHEAAVTDSDRCGLSANMKAGDMRPHQTPTPGQAGWYLLGIWASPLARWDTYSCGKRTRVAMLPRLTVGMRT